jgi:hypothetical protein
MIAEGGLAMQEKHHTSLHLKKSCRKSMTAPLSGVLTEKAIQQAMTSLEARNAELARAR